MNKESLIQEQWVAWYPLENLHDTHFALITANALVDICALYEPQIVLID